MCPSRFLPALASCIGTIPKYFPIDLMLVNRPGSSMYAATASAVRGPTPGIVRSSATRQSLAPIVFSSPSAFLIC